MFRPAAIHHTMSVVIVSASACAVMIIVVYTSFEMAPIKRNLAGLTSSCEIDQSPKSPRRNILVRAGGVAGAPVSLRPRIPLNLQQSDEPTSLECRDNVLH
jgi:hypothetical protein